MPEFEVLAKAEPAFFVKCEVCDHEFWVDSSIEENLIRVKKENGNGIELIEKCPRCRTTRNGEAQ
jgi:hypothetical protein